LTQHLEDVLVTLGVRAARDVGVRQLVDQHHLGLAFQHRVEIQLAQDDATVVDRPRRDLGQAQAERLGVGAAVSLDDPGHHVHSLRLQPVTFEQHLVGLADAGTVAQVHLQAAAPRALDEVEEAVGRRLGGGGGHGARR
jgi:hypothetical protein